LANNERCRKKQELKMCLVTKPLMLQPVPLCKCGCGQEVNYNNDKHKWSTYIKNHDKKVIHPLCICGCGERVERRKKGRWENFKLGHSSRVLATRNQRRVLMPNAPLCACGCGEAVFYDVRRRQWNTYISGHNGRGKTLSEDACRSISIRMTGRNISEETRQKYRDSHIGISHKVSDATKSKMHFMMLGDKNPRFGKESTMKGKHHSEEMKAKQSIRVRLLWQDKQWRESNIRASVLGQLKNPTRPERRFMDLCARCNLPYRYNSFSLDLIVGGRIPDFCDINGKKEVVEVFGRYFHTPPIAPYAQTERGKINHYRANGYDCIILWDDEDDETWLRKVLRI
jgi:hypothetical protein